MLGRVQRAGQRLGVDPAAGDGRLVDGEPERARGEAAGRQRERGGLEQPAGGELLALEADDLRRDLDLAEVHGDRPEGARAFDVEHRDRDLAPRLGVGVAVGRHDHGPAGVEVE